MKWIIALAVFVLVPVWVYVVVRFATRAAYRSKIEYVTRFLRRSPQNEADKTKC